MFGSGVISSLSYNLDTAVFDADQVSLSLIGWWILQLSVVWRPQTTFMECACPQWLNGHKCLYVNCEGFSLLLISPVKHDV